MTASTPLTNSRWWKFIIVKGLIPWHALIYQVCTCASNFVRGSTRYSHELSWSFTLCIGLWDVLSTVLISDQQLTHHVLNGQIQGSSVQRAKLKMVTNFLLDLASFTVACTALAPHTHHMAASCVWGTWDSTTLLFILNGQVCRCKWRPTYLMATWHKPRDAFVFLWGDVLCVCWEILCVCVHACVAVCVCVSMCVFWDRVWVSDFNKVTLITLLLCCIFCRLCFQIAHEKVVLSCPCPNSLNFQGLMARIWSFFFFFFFFF